MKFSSKEERDSLIESFKIKAKELTEAKRADKNTKPEYNCTVTFDTRTEYDEVTKDEKGEIVTIDENGNTLTCSGDIYVFYIKQPSLDQAIQILTAAKPPLGNEYNSGKVAWDIMIDKVNSSPEIQTDRIKLGYLLRLINRIDALLSDQKKS